MQVLAGVVFTEGSSELVDTLKCLRQHTDVGLVTDAQDLNLVGRGERVMEMSMKLLYRVYILILELKV